MTPSTTHTVAFAALALLTLVPAVLVVSLRNLVHAALCLGASFIGVAGLYLLLNAEFIAAAQVLVYVGAITVLILFAIMLTQGVTGSRFVGQSHTQPILGLATAGVVMLVLGSFLIRQPWPIVADPGIVPNTPRVLGVQLLTTYIIPFEVSSVLLLVALVAAIILAHDEAGLSVKPRTNKVYDGSEQQNEPTTGRQS